MLKIAPSMRLVAADAVWDRMLLGIWQDSALPVERGVRVQNALGDWMGATPVQNIHFPFDNQTLPGTFESPAWGALQDPMNDSKSPCNNWTTTLDQTLLQQRVPRTLSCPVPAGGGSS